MDYNQLLNIDPWSLVAWNKLLKEAQVRFLNHRRFLLFQLSMFCRVVGLILPVIYMRVRLNNFPVAVISGVFTLHTR